MCVLGVVPFIVCLHECVCVREETLNLLSLQAAGTFGGSFGLVFFPWLILSFCSWENSLITAVIPGLDVVLGTKDPAMFLVLFSTNGLDKKEKKNV